MTLRKQLVVLFALTILVMLGAITDSVEAQGTCGIQYKVGYRGASYPGSTVTIVNNFTNSGSLAMQVTSVTVTIDFGTFSAPSSSLPLSVPVGSTDQGLDFDIQVPSTASVGSHPVSASAAFQCNESGTWVTPSFSPLVLTGGSFPVGQNPGTSALIGLAILGAIVALAVAVVVLVIKRKRKPAAPMPPPAYMPPPPPPPSQTPPGQ